MKKKKLSGLSLNKKTISELNKSVAHMIKGGGYTQQYETCVNCTGGGGGSGPATGIAASCYQCTVGSACAC